VPTKAKTNKPPSRARRGAGPSVSTEQPEQGSAKASTAAGKSRRGTLTPKRSASKRSKTAASSPVSRSNTPAPPADVAKNRRRPQVNPAKGKPAFPKKTTQPTVAEFPARLQQDLGRAFEDVRSHLAELPDVREGVHFYGPKTGWGLRYQQGASVLCALIIFGDQPLAVLSLDAEAQKAVPWKSLSGVAQEARTNASGSPALLWFDMPLGGTGASDTKALIRAKIEAAKRPH